MPKNQFSNIDSRLRIAAAYRSLNRSIRRLTDAVQELKPTAKGNLPRKFCREAALAYWDEETYQEHTRYGGINKEDDFSDLHITRLVAELAGMIRKYKGRFILSRDCRKLLAGNGFAAIYPTLFRTYVEQFNWGYRDRYPELRFIQSAFLFTLYLLMRYGDTWRTLMRFAAFLGLAAVDPVSEERFCHQYRVKALPLLPEG